MKQEEKELLIKDLCARLPYRVKGTVTYRNGVGKIYNVVKYINGEIYYKFSEKSGIWYDNIVIKPYLYPLSSMTEEQKEELFFNYIHNDIYIDDFIDYFLAGELWHDITVGLDMLPGLIDWLNKNHFDYRGLIQKGLAIDATGLNIY